jgi:DNA-binding LacI/PurR family transcriptional regulator
LPSDLRAEANEKHEALKKTIAIAVSSPETSVFWINLIHEIAKEASAHNANIMYTYLPKEIDSTYTLPSFLTDGTVNGMIVLNVYDDALIKMLASLNLPKVFMDTSTTIPFAQLNGDLLLIEGRSSVAQITESIIAQGKKTYRIHRRHQIRPDQLRTLLRFQVCYERTWHQCRIRLLPYRPHRCRHIQRRNRKIPEQASTSSGCLYLRQRFRCQYCM